LIRGYDFREVIKMGLFSSFKKNEVPSELPELATDKIGDSKGLEKNKQMVNDHLKKSEFYSSPSEEKGLADPGLSSVNTPYANYKVSPYAEGGFLQSAKEAPEKEAPRPSQFAIQQVPEEPPSPPVSIEPASRPEPPQPEPPSPPIQPISHPEPHPEPMSIHPEPIPHPEPAMDVRELEKEIRSEKQAISRQRISEPVRNVSPTESASKKKKLEIEESFFKDLEADINKEMKNLDKLENWHRNKFLPTDVVADMKDYWAGQKQGSFARLIGRNFKERIYERTVRLQQLEKDWQNIYFDLVEKEEDIRNEEKELKKLLSEFVKLAKSKTKKKKK